MNTVVSDHVASGRTSLQISLANPPGSSAISLLVPFDIGQTFIFNSKKTEKKEVEKEWNSIFARHPHAADWSTDQLDDFQKSMGWIATWRCFAGTEKPKLNAALEQLRASIPGELDRSRDGIRAIIFPNGIGVLIIRITAPPIDDPKWSAFRDEAIRKKSYAACRVILATAAACYLDFMNHVVNLPGIPETRFIERLEPVSRIHGIVRAEYAYPLVFFDSDEEARWYAGQPVSGITSYGDARLYIGWAETAIAKGQKDRIQIERNFIIALAGWFALLVMSNRSSHYILQAIFALASNRPAHDGIEGEAIQLAYMEAANQAFPIQWTSNERDMVLLETIHNCWSSSRWWKNVERKTRLLAAHTEQLNAESDEQWNRGIARWGATIACLTLASAIVDVWTLSGENTDLFPYAFFIPLALGICLFFYLGKSFRSDRRDGKARKKHGIPKAAFSLDDKASSPAPESAVLVD